MNPSFASAAFHGVSLPLSSGGLEGAVDTPQGTGAGQHVRMADHAVAEIDAQAMQLAP